MVQRGNRNPKPRPRFIPPMECVPVPILPETGEWIYEIKQDGYRVIGIVDGGLSFLYSMSGLDYSTEFSHVAFALRELKQGDLVLDGEIVALDETGRARFQELQNRQSTRFTIVYYIFDVLHWNGMDLIDLPLAERRKRLDRIAAVFKDPLRLNPVFRTRLHTLVEQVTRLGLEGIVAKRDNSIYLPGKVSEAWQKHRFNQEGEFVIGGYVRAGTPFSSLIIGEYRGKNNKLHYVKRVAAGFTRPLRERVYNELMNLETSECPFVNLPEKSKSGHGLTAEKMRDCTWLKPERHCEVEFVERTREGRLRHAVFRRLLEKV
jgi:DNA ligase D-like protein (predicted ligase)